VDINELNKVLSDEIYKLRSGKAKPERVNAITRAAGRILEGARLQLQAAKLVGRHVDMPVFGKAKSLPAQKRLPNKKAAAK
jgi:hypothetical protein